VTTTQQRTVDALVGEWRALRELVAELTPEQWTTPTCLPGWDVRDQVAHVIGTEQMLAGEPTPDLPPDAPTDHLRNDIAKVNEAFVATLRSLPVDQLLATFDDVTARRTEALRSMSPEEFDAPSWTPAGQATYGRFMQIRVFDCWMHEQDIRAALDVPGHTQGAPAEVALDEVALAVGYLVGKKAAAPDGSLVTIHLTGPIVRSFHVLVEGRAGMVDEPPRPSDATISLPSALFMRLAGGRVDPESVVDQVRIEGDQALGRQVATHLAYTI
jgi:uncharacterized protein (TIGR03083 family)